MKTYPDNKTLISLLEDYKPNEDIFSEDEPLVYKLKKIVDSLDDTDKRIFLMYAELQNQSEVARRLFVSTPTVCRKINSIKNTIFERLYDEQSI